jgi:hypothetical protein
VRLNPVEVIDGDVLETGLGQGDDGSRADPAGADHCHGLILEVGRAGDVELAK